MRYLTSAIYPIHPTPSHYTPSNYYHITHPQDNSSHFYESLQHWKELNLTHAFSQFTKEVEPLSASMPLLVHNWQEVVGVWMKSVESADDEGLKPLLECVF